MVHDNPFWDFSYGWKREEDQQKSPVQKSDKSASSMTPTTPWDRTDTAEHPTDKSAILVTTAIPQSEPQLLMGLEQSCTFLELRTKTLSSFLVFKKIILYVTLVS